ncbi:hypothetical protein H6F32_10055 [Anabaena sp. FACHB-1237]|uniref:hypothetical protein n=1 Tax=Anabaena sp. FACHB-1237 TaxID=2692769 RepID=UPI001681286F|nr:hypothetical protein [Anabaena sp. FACHB-1237]MBD2137922.1 hypothetical protein [Anabaena sp. FACHB-1237]
MCLKYIVSLTTIIAIIASPVIAQEVRDPQSNSPQMTPPLNTPVNTNIPNQRNNNFQPPQDTRNFNNTPTSVSFPTCISKICIFTLMRQSSKNSFMETEFIGGIIWQFGGYYQNTQAEYNKLEAIVKKEKIDQESTLILINKLAEAIDSKKIEIVKLYAISLYKRLGYANYYELLQEIINPTELLKY